MPLGEELENLWNYSLDCNPNPRHSLRHVFTSQDASIIVSTFAYRGVCPGGAGVEGRGHQAGPPDLENCGGYDTRHVVWYNKLDKCGCFIILFSMTLTILLYQV